MSKITIKEIEDFESITVAQSPRQTGYLTVVTHSSVNKYITIYDHKNITIRGQNATFWEVLRLVDQFNKVNVVAEIEDYGTKYARVLSMNFTPIILDDKEDDDEYMWIHY
jgi:hypothetical protein